MTDPADLPDAAALYVGEPVPRSRALALGLTVLMPGLGHVYAGQFAGGLLRYLLLFFFAVGGLLAWRAFLFQPHLPLLVLGASTAVYLGVLLKEVWDITGPSTRDYVPRAFNNPLVYAAMLLVIHALPLSVLVDTAGASLLTAVEVDDGGMFPMLFIGDRVLIDRTTYRSFPPERGQLVVVRSPESDKLLVRRVLAGPGDTVAFEGRIPVVNLRLLTQTPVGVLSLEGVDNRGQPAGIHLEGVREDNASVSYTVTLRPDFAREDVDSVELGVDEFYTLADNRDGGDDSRRFGPVSRADILGRPLYVWWSRDPDERNIAWSRLGLAAR